MSGSTPIRILLVGDRILSLWVGMPAAYVHVYVGGAALFALVLRGWAVPTPSPDLVPRFDVRFLTAVSISVITLPASGTILAIHRATSADPDAVIRE